jgi:hypothetical protein
MGRKKDRSRFTDKGSKWSRRTKLYIFGGMVVILISIYMYNWQFTIDYSRDSSTEKNIPKISDKKIYRAPIRKRSIPPNSKTVLVTNVYDVDQQDQFEIFYDRWLSLATEATELRGRTEPCLEDKQIRKSEFVQMDVMELANDVQQTVLSLYNFDDLRQYTPIAIRNSKKHSNQVVIFALHEPYEKRQNNTLIFEKHRLSTEEERIKCDEITAKLATMMKANVLNLSFAYLLTLLSTIGHQFTVDGISINATAFSTGYVSLRSYQHVLLVEGSRMEDIQDAAHIFDTQNGYIGVVDSPASAPKTVRARSINPLVNLKKDIEIRDRGEPFVKHSWVTLSLNDPVYSERIIEIDLSAMQYDKKQGLAPLVTANFLERIRYGYDWRSMYTPEESVIRLGTKYFKNAVESKPSTGDDLLSAIDANVFVNTIVKLIEEWDPEYISSFKMLHH